ncbi:hypothetical protein [Streptomyces cadmiisoli]|uniref:Uncharacterized protein n=1 Tax=Streptomyces cadmiisoli TaxID=2184053 RepID=A0A2Z4J8P9_9ACTN|nr:hypothetical protein [Streptomyces cadmiisoli]AWW40773.1 hypothetical protein DN051_32255 [Streptomyces cadmiisoli]
MANGVVHQIILKAKLEEGKAPAFDASNVVTVSALEEFLMEVKDATNGYDDPLITVTFDRLTYEYEEN